MPRPNTPMKLPDLIAEWQDMEPDERLQALVELADELPPLSANRAAVPLPEHCKVQECQTPVYLWVDVQPNGIHLEADVPRKSPTVRGLVTLVVQGLEGATPQQVLAMPDDLLPSLGLQEALGMTRQQGLRGLVARIKREVRRKIAEM
jgi:cysteine desulfuration protein SufE